MKVHRHILLTLLLAIISLSLTAQEKEDTSYIFRFVADKEQLIPQEPQQTAATVTDDTKNHQYQFFIRGNLLRWATLTPDIGVEWRINPTVSVLVNGTYTTWCWNEKERKYAQWEVAPEVRWYLRETRHGYLGAMYKTGTYNYKFTHTGKQGNVMGGGVTAGYQLPISKALMLDFSLALGWLDIKVEKYTIENGERVFQDEEDTSWSGPINVGITLVWRVF